MVRKDDFDSSVSLPPDLEIAAMKLKGKGVYLRKDVVIRDGKPIPRNGNGEDT